MAKKIVQFKAVKVVKKPATVTFYTKDGRRVLFRATKIVEMPLQERIKRNEKDLFT